MSSCQKEVAAFWISEALFETKGLPWPPEWGGNKSKGTLKIRWTYMGIYGVCVYIYIYMYFMYLNIVWVWVKVCETHVGTTTFGLCLISITTLTTLISSPAWKRTDEPPCFQLPCKGIWRHPSELFLRHIFRTIAVRLACLMHIIVIHCAFLTILLCLDAVALASKMSEVAKLLCRAGFAAVSMYRWAFWPKEMHLNQLVPYSQFFLLQVAFGHRLIEFHTGFDWDNRANLNRQETDTSSGNRIIVPAGAAVDPEGDGASPMCRGAILASSFQYACSCGSVFPTLQMLYRVEEARMIAHIAHMYCNLPEKNVNSESEWIWGIQHLESLTEQ